MLSRTSHPISAVCSPGQLFPLFCVACRCYQTSYLNLVIYNHKKLISLSQEQQRCSSETLALHKIALRAEQGAENTMVRGNLAQAATDYGSFRAPATWEEFHAAEASTKRPWRKVALCIGLLIAGVVLLITGVAGYLSSASKGTCK